MSSPAATPSPTPSITPPPPQGGVLEGMNPSKYNKNDPITVFIIQAFIIIVFCRLLHYPLSRLRQPRVIAEVIGGILLGPSVMGRIGGFSDSIFPKESLPNLNLVANVGLVLFLFLVGLEVDMRLFVSNWKVALSVGAAGMILPFGLGCAIAYGLYHQFRGDINTSPDIPHTVNITFGVYMLFIGVAMAITAFPVLCRILTELKLLGTSVGLVVLSAGVGNDVVGWILLALCVALVNAGSGLTALWVLLTGLGYVLFLAYAVRPLFLWYLNRSGSLQNGPTQGVVGLTLLMALGSAFFTGIIGIHPIFGGFLIGLICPHEGGFAIKMTEKVEDLVTVLLLPLYFALSGLKTNIGLLNSGIVWAYVIGVIAVAFSGKIIGGTLAARACGMVWRESLTVGVLMSCKGLVELIVLNIGLSAGILSETTFTIFVVMALVTTFATTPLTSFLYPASYQKKLELWRRGEIDWDGNLLSEDDGSLDHDTITADKLNATEVHKLLVYLRLDSLPSLFTFISLLGGNGTTSSGPKVHPRKFGKAEEPYPPSATSRSKSLEVHGLRMVELSQRTSSVMKGSEIEEFAYRDAIVNAFRTFGQLNDLAVSGNVSIVPEGSFAESLVSKAADQGSDFVLIPWSESGSMAEEENALLPSSSEDRFSGVAHNRFVSDAFATATCDMAVFVNRGFGGPSRDVRAPLLRIQSGLSIRSSRDPALLPVADRSHHVFMPFFGGKDDRVALRFVLQLARNPNVTATILYVGSHGADAKSEISVPAEAAAATPASPKSPRLPLSPRFTLHGDKSASEVVATPLPETNVEHEHQFFNTQRASLALELQPRVLFEEVSTKHPLKEAISHAQKEVGKSAKNAGDLIVVGRGIPSGHGVSSEAKKNLGAVAEACITGDIRASVLVIQAGKKF
ncbi:MAG: hypothetical protein M1825_002522 [Sarcosagium campestre]|nr:MAG: hypothetical protein M1825_002522 [Sarcosagium campestre]